MEDIAKAIENLMFRRRDEGETAFPDLPTLDWEIRQVKNERMKAARAEEERKQFEDEQRDIREHPENYINVGDVIHNFISEKRKKIEETLDPGSAFRALVDPLRRAKKTPPGPAAQVERTDPNLNALSPSDFLALAELIEKNPALSSFSPEDLRARAR